MMSTPSAKTVLLFMMTALCMGLVGCGGGDGTPVAGDKLLIIGIDSADWEILDPMLESGRLPNLRSFMDQSAHGRMRTFVPFEKSPLLWASILTGVKPEVHGVSHFVKGSDQKPVIGSAWYAPAVWDMIGAVDKTTAVVGMWTTYPARPIPGVMVSDYLPYGRGREKPLADLVYPDSLTEKVIALRMEAEAKVDSYLPRFFPEGKLAEIEAAYPREVEKLRSILAADLSYVAVSRELARSDEFDLFLFYLRGPDMVGHYFFKYHKPEQIRGGVNPEMVDALGRVVEAYYEFSDEVMGDVLGWFPPDHPTVVLSDHGFHGPRPGMNKGVEEHNEWGIFLVRSPLYEAGVRFGHLELLDCCPTFLALLGLPPAEDMPGKILAEGLTAEGRKRQSKMEKQRVPTYLPLRPAEGPAGEQDEAVNEEIRKQLRSLGYIN